MGNMLLPALSGLWLCAAAAVMASAAPATQRLPPQRLPPRRVGNAFIQPDAVCRWGDLLQIEIIDGRLAVQGKAPPEIRPFIANRRGMHVQIGDSPDAVWLVQGLDRAAPRPGATLPPLHFTAMPRHRVPPDGTPATAPVRVYVMPGQFRLAGRIGGEEHFTDIDFRSNSLKGEVQLKVRDTVRGKPPPQAPIALTCGDLAQLCAAEPLVVRRHLRPLLAAVNEGKDLLRPRAGDVYRVFDSIPPDPAVAEKVAQLVAEFDQLDPAVRESAFARLEALGPPAVLAAVRFDRTGLAPEQRSRLDGFVADWSLRQGDGTLREASALRRDVAFLLDCLDDDDRAVRLAALELLRTQTGRPIEFDPDASPEARLTGIATLAERLSSEQ